MFGAFIRFCRLIWVQIAFAVGVAVSVFGVMLNHWETLAQYGADLTPHNKWLYENVWSMPPLDAALLCASLVFVVALCLKVVALSAQLKPAFLCRFSPQIVGCVRTGTPISPRGGGLFNQSPRTNTSSSTTITFWGGATSLTPQSLAARNVPKPITLATYYRVEVIGARQKDIKNCYGLLTLIERDGAPVFEGEKIKLPFAPSEASDAISKTVRRVGPEHLDVFRITKENLISICSYDDNVPGSVDWDNMFTRTGNYRFHVAVVGDDDAASEIDIFLNWKGDHKTAIASGPARAI